MAQGRTRWMAGGAIVAVLAFSGMALGAQLSQPTNNLPNPYQSVSDWAKLPDGRHWGSTAGIDIAPDGKSVWAVDRCGTNTCVGSNLDPILKFDTSGKLVKSFGKGMFAFPHGIFVDADENIWVTDAVLGDGRGKGAVNIGQTVQKFDKNGKKLMTLGTPGVNGDDATHFNAPSDVVVASNGDIFVSDGHGPGTNERIVRFDKSGKFIKQWGHPGSGPGAFSSLHSLAMDSRGRLFVANRDNNRIDLFDQDGKLLDSWEQFSRPSGIYIDKNDVMYVCDSESGSAAEAHQDWTRGIRVGSAKDGSVKYLIPDPDKTVKGTSAAEGCAADKDGIIYGAEVGPKRLMRYVMKK
ncbi:MAG TPA: peptidyl-alpha-hydroxyglycine alpha-amidating lyase family protein [Micropepsaceae bacterium]|nr:peptidyl-alpha-hydroxyglycine alpha-amidating lyase family protein [Micropepsaceae bacterium]